ncbi:hypothetical protein HG537_0D05510 [Torulaspora globosa]|uniref:Peroxin/Ferlin domain-containing protein n=1 Tax=Torulaspora globosa TaxID=48254 RepID=A0A7H9HT65_9SACH|nr:hypothetical protein HG537_0D05510 [Torulaspora sp. CBS 2947]
MMISKSGNAKKSQLGHIYRLGTCMVGLAYYPNLDIIGTKTLFWRKSFCAYFYSGKNTNRWITIGDGNGCCIVSVECVVGMDQQTKKKKRKKKKDLFFQCLDELPGDIFVENERGISFLGYPFFSARLLIPRLDPTNFQLVNCDDGVLKNISNASVHTIAGLYPLVKDETKNEDSGCSKWFVLMDFPGKIDMDDQGWVYSWHFATERWKSKHGLVRRRVWVKLSEKGIEKRQFGLRRLPQTTLSTSDSYITAIDDQEWLVRRLASSLLDRKRFELLDELCESGDLNLGQLRDEQLCRRVRDCFQYESSADRFCKVWLPSKITELSSL